MARAPRPGRALLDAVAPAIAVYSAGEGNQYGHPHPEVIERLAAAEVEVYCTDVHGTVVVTTDGSHIDVAVERDGSPIQPRASTPEPQPEITAEPEPEPDPEPAFYTAPRGRLTSQT